MSGHHATTTGAAYRRGRAAITQTGYPNEKRSAIRAAWRTARGQGSWRKVVGGDADARLRPGLKRESGRGQCVGLGGLNLWRGRGMLR